MRTEGTGPRPEARSGTALRWRTAAAWRRTGPRQPPDAAARPPGPARVKPSRRARVHPAVDRAAAYAWRIAVIALTAWGALLVLGRLRIVVLPLAAAVLIARALWPLRAALARRLPTAAAALLSLLLLVGALAGLGALIGQGLASEASNLSDAVRDGVERVETWLVEDSGFDVERADLEQFRASMGDALSGSALSRGAGPVVSGARLVVEIAAGLLLSLVLTFFFLKDGERLAGWVRHRAPPARRPAWEAMASAAWSTLGGYLRGAALLGAVEGAAIGAALALTGASLALPVAVLTFTAAFVPIAGAVAAGVVAVLVALATAGLPAALTVGVVALVVQQLDNDLLVPFVYGRALRLHAAVVLVVLTAGTALFGLAGAFLAVPVTAVVVSAWSAAREASGRR